MKIRKKNGQQEQIGTDRAHGKGAGELGSRVDKHPVVVFASCTPSLCPLPQKGSPVGFF